MDPRLLDYYNRELRYMKELGGEFAREFPKVAGRLGIDGFEVADPYVERLLEGFAFLTARLHLKLDAEFPRFTQNLLEVLYPHYLAPTPSMTIVEMRPSAAEGALASGYRVPRASLMRSVLGRDEQTACHYSTAHEVMLWPIELVRLEYGAYLADLGNLTGRLPRAAKAALRLRLRTTSGLRWNQLELESLPLFLRAPGGLALRLHEQLTAHCVGSLVRPADAASGAGAAIVWEMPVRPLGFDDDQALLPFGPRSFHGYRHLQEYFAFHQRFLFVELTGLGAGVKQCAGPELEIVLLLDSYEPALEGALDASHVALHCTPAINLFPRRADRIHLSDSEHEYHVVPDRTRPMDFEVWAITDVRGYGSSSDEVRTFHPLYAQPERKGDVENAGAFYTINRQLRVLSARQRAKGPRSSYVGSEVFVSLVDGSEGPFRSDLKQLAIETLCTNRDLPLHMSIGIGETDFTLDMGAPVSSIKVLAGPTAPARSHAQGEMAWRLIGHLGIDYLSLVDGPGDEGAAALRELLSLYVDPTDSALARQVDGVRSVSSQAITRRIPVPGPTAFGRGLEVTVTLDEARFESSGAYLLAAVLERFFAKYASINSFSETVLRTLQRGEVRRWPPRTGQLHAL